jgi:hypothetical protein
MKQIFNKFGLPDDLVYLPHVESSFNPKAYSKFGAAGIWQFTRSTGRQYLTVDYAVDERRDPIRASVAAARLLKQNYKKFKKWPSRPITTVPPACGEPKGLRVTIKQYLKNTGAEFLSLHPGIFIQNF